MIETLDVVLSSRSFFFARASNIASDTPVCPLSPGQLHLNERVPRSLTQQGGGGVRALDVEPTHGRSGVGERKVLACELGADAAYERSIRNMRCCVVEKLLGECGSAATVRIWEKR
jgi:hypothetical protein